MGNELGGAYIGQMIAKDAMHKALYGKAKKKKALRCAGMKCAIV